MTKQSTTPRIAFVASRKYVQSRAITCTGSRFDRFGWLAVVFCGTLLLGFDTAYRKLAIELTTLANGRNEA